MDRTSKIIIFLSQMAALSVVLTFILGMRWQAGFFEGLGFPWLSGYFNYLDTIRFGVPHALVLGGSVAIGSFITWMIVDKNKDLLPYLFLLALVLLTMSDLIPSFFYKVGTFSFLNLQSFYQVIFAGFIIGCVLVAPPRLKKMKAINSKWVTTYQMLVLLFGSIVMIAFFSSPYTIGKADAQKAISSGFEGYSLATDSRSEYWSIVGHSQGNLILARLIKNKNQVQVKISNNVSDWVIYSTAPQGLGAISTP
ncbi:hypothetical protein [Pseudomonas sp. AK106]